MGVGAGQNQCYVLKLLHFGVYAMIAHLGPRVSGSIFVPQACPRQIIDPSVIGVYLSIYTSYEIVFLHLHVDLKDII